MIRNLFFFALGAAAFWVWEEACAVKQYVRGMMNE